MLIIGTEMFREASFANEAELEEVVTQHAKLLFGAGTVYISKKSLVRTEEGRGTIPDALVLNYEEEVWYLVEVELISHGVWRHIVPQLTTQMVACSNQQTKDLITDRVLEHISSDPELKSDPTIYQRAVSILHKSPMVAIPIDATSADLEKWAQIQRLQVSIWEIQKFQSVIDPQRVAYSFPANNEPSVIATPANAPLSGVRRASSKNIAELIDAGLLQDGESLFLSYKGQQFNGVARREGIELGGTVYSLSDAAVRCYAQTGASRPTENGWRVWRNKDDATLNELYEKLAEQEIPSA